jgi:hypothetical protein
MTADMERQKFEGKWSFSGSLPIDPLYISTVYPYRVRKVPEVYSNREEPSACYVHLHSGFSNSLGWETDGKSNNLTVFGWLVGEELRGAMVTTPKAFALFSGHLKIEGSAIAPEGVLVAWMVGDAGQLIPLDKINDDLEASIRLAAMNGDLETLSELAASDSKNPVFGRGGESV